MRNRIVIAALYAEACKYHVARVATEAKEIVVEHKSELACIVAASTAVGLAARVAGFKAGYEFAKTSNLNTAV